MKAIVWIILITLMSMTVMATGLEDTQIDYFSYKEVTAGDHNILYKIKLTNTGNHPKTYEIAPDTGAVMQLGTYRVDPAEKITIKPGKSETAYFYLMLDNEVTQRISLPVTITSGSENTTLQLSARNLANSENGTAGFLSQLLNFLLYLLIAIIIIAVLVRLFKRRKKEDGGDQPEVETYY